MKTEDIRQNFLEFFAQKDHQIVNSSSLVPFNDPTLLFTNAGMNQFKDLFLGYEKREYCRAATSQKCVRAGGKHNDLENVGYTARHHTFFEMLGNFSFGDYFKEQAISYAWELLTEVYKLPAEKLLVTVFHSDEEAFAIWRDKIGIAPEKIIRIGIKEDGTSDNFWQMGDTGPCGPCSEIFYDHGEQIWGGPPGSEEENGDRFIEIWNLVFMQFNRDEKGTLHALPNPSIDTGMGLERIAAILQGVHSNYEIDLFVNLIKATAKAINVTDLANNSLKVISDHIRSISFLICDGVLPSNEGRGYVLRRIIRRAIRHGYSLGQEKPFLYTLVEALIKEMGGAFPDLIIRKIHIEATILDEENRFLITLEHGLRLLENDIKNFKDRTIPGETIFKLYDTYGFPVDLTNDIARERNYLLDMEGFEVCMEEQRARARAASKFNASEIIQLSKVDKTDFKGYVEQSTSAMIINLAIGLEEVTSIKEDDEAIIILDNTPFYAESGGQVGDSGLIRGDGFEFLVKDTVQQHGTFIHVGIVKSGSISLYSQVEAIIDNRRRELIKRNHSATHLLHKALQEFLGNHIEQKGSMVSDTRLRFDFSHNSPLTFIELQAIEYAVNIAIYNNHPVDIKTMQIDDAKTKGAMALFGEKYGEVVRVIQMGNSIELCGGTHVERTGDIGHFKIISETGIAAGVRRIEAITNLKALELLMTHNGTFHNLTKTLNTDNAHIISRVDHLLEENRSLKRELNQANSKLAFNNRDLFIKNAIDIQGIKIVIESVNGADNRILRELCDNIQAETHGITLLISKIEDKVTLVSAVSDTLTSQIKASELLNAAALCVGGKGGGRPNSATGGGTQPENINQALSEAKIWVKNQLIK